MKVQKEKEEYQGAYRVGDGGIIYKTYVPQKKTDYPRTYAALLEKIGPARMEEIRLEAGAMVRGLMAFNNKEVALP